jgi:aminomethyltransferase
MPLYGHELNEEITPIQAGLDFAVNLESREFHGRDALLAAAENPNLPRRVGLVCAGRRVPREGYPILHGEMRVGEVTSGTFSPTLEKPLAMGYVAPDAAEVGTPLSIEIRGRSEAAQVVDLPFYRRG